MAPVDEAAQHTLWDIVRDVTFCMLVTQDGESLRSRPMTLESDESSGEFRFVTRLSSATVAEIADNDHVNLAFADPGTHVYVSVSGRARVVQDRELLRQVWEPKLAQFFDGGADDPDLAVIRVLPDRAEYWDGRTDVPAANWEFVRGGFDRALGGGENRKVDM